MNESPVLLLPHQPCNLRRCFLRHLDFCNPPTLLAPTLRLHPHDRGLFSSSSFTATITPVTGALMSEALLTDSTAPMTSPVLTGSDSVDSST